MSEENRTPTRPFFDVGDIHLSGGSASEVEDNLQSQLLDRRLSLNKLDRRINAIVAPPSYAVRNVNAVSGRI